MLLARDRDDVFEFGQGHAGIAMVAAAASRPSGYSRLAAQPALRHAGCAASGCWSSSRGATSRAPAAAARRPRRRSAKRSSASPRLACAHEFARAADLEVAPGDLEAVGGLDHRLQPRLAGRADSGVACTAARRRWRPRRGRRGRAAGAAAPGRSARHARSPSGWRWARRRRPRSPWSPPARCIWPPLNCAITAAFSAAGMRAVQQARPSLPGSARAELGVRLRWRSAGRACSLSSISGQTQ